MGPSDAYGGEDDLDSSYATLPRSTLVRHPYNWTSRILIRIGSFPTEAGGRLPSVTCPRAVAYGPVPPVIAKACGAIGIISARHGDLTCLQWCAGRRLEPVQGLHVEEEAAGLIEAVTRAGLAKKGSEA